jgi:hypothetical protein
MSDSEYTTSEDDEQLTNNINNEQKGLTLQEVNDMVKEYEKDQKKERKIRKDALINIKDVELDADTIRNKIVLSRAQLKQLRKESLPQKERTPKQKQQVEKLLDLRKKKLEDEKEQASLRLKVADKQKKTRKKIVHERIDPNTLLDSDGEEVKEEPIIKTKSFQAKKPAFDDEIDTKVNQLNKINDVLSNNPYYAMLMKSRGIKI